MGCSGSKSVPVSQPPKGTGTATNGAPVKPNVPASIPSKPHHTPDLGGKETEHHVGSPLEQVVAPPTPVLEIGRGKTPSPPPIVPVAAEEHSAAPPPRSPSPQPSAVDEQTATEPEIQEEAAPAQESAPPVEEEAADAAQETSAPDADPPADEEA